MVAEYVPDQLEEKSERAPAVPPGFLSYKLFTLQKIHDEIAPAPFASDSLQVQIDSDDSIFEYDNFQKSLRHKPWINYKECCGSSEDEEWGASASEQEDYSASLPKGVVRGCAECNSCQKVIARWRPGESQRPDLEEVPVFYPNEEEFRDTIRYIAAIRPKAEPYGICRIVPPPSWRPPCPLKEKVVWENSKFSTRIQRVDKLQRRKCNSKAFRTRGTAPRKRRRLLELQVHNERNKENAMILTCHNGSDRFGFESGPDFTLETFQRYADDFKDQYFGPEDVDMGLYRGKFEPTVENIEGEYWRIVEKPTEEIEVIYGADLETRVFGSGFPKQSSTPSNSNMEELYVNAGWNLNNLSRLPGSVLSFESTDISGIIVPWLYIGMCFSSFCWHVEDHHLYSVNYLHWGAPKTWYCVPRKYAIKLEATMKKHLPDLFKEQPNLLHSLVTQFSPSILKREGVPVYRCVQQSGEFVVTFPRAYHSGFNCGFNCAEAVNLAPVDWLPHGLNSVDLYREQGRKITISHDKLLLGAAKEAVRVQWNISFSPSMTTENSIWHNACGSSGILTKSLKARVELERLCREYIGRSSCSRKMDADFDTNNERECVICHCDLYLSAIGCPCSPDRFACLKHAKKLCSCSWSIRFFLFRYEISELNVLVDALGGKLSAVYKWGLSDLGLSMSSWATKDKSEKHGSIRETPREGTVQEERGSQNESSGSQKKNDLFEDGKGLVETEKTLCDAVNSKQSMKQNNSKSDKFPKDPEVVGNLENFAQTSSGTSMPLAGQVNLTETSPSFVRENESSLHTINEVHASKLSNPIQSEEINSKHNVICSTETASPAKSMSGVSISKGIPASLAEGNCGARNDLQHVKLPGIIKTTSAESLSKTSSSESNDFMYKREFLEENQHNTVNLDLDNHFEELRPVAMGLQRTNYTVEVLEYGVVLSGSLWSTRKTIFPRGYKSRVKYFSVLNPAHMCSYSCEILDAGLPGPLFMVQLEESPSEKFFHTCPSTCWDTIREKVNEEIRKQRSLGRSDLPLLQPSGSLDGLGMFGLSSEETIKLLEEMDANHICSEYWASRSGSTRPLVSFPSCSKAEQGNKAELGNCIMELAETDVKLEGLFKKASEDELSTLYCILVDDRSSTKQRMIDLINKGKLAEMDAVLEGLLQKSSADELSALYYILASDRPSTKQQAIDLINKEHVDRC